MCGSVYKSYRISKLRTFWTLWHFKEEHNSNFLLGTKRHSHSPAIRIKLLVCKFYNVCGDRVEVVWNLPNEYYYDLKVSSLLKNCLLWKCIQKCLPEWDKPFYSFQIQIDNILPLCGCLVLQLGLRKVVCHWPCTCMTLDPRQQHLNKRVYSLNISHLRGKQRNTNRERKGMCVCVCVCVCCLLYTSRCV